MRKKNIIYPLFFFIFFSAYSQTDSPLSMWKSNAERIRYDTVESHAPISHDVYKLNPAFDIPIVALGTAFAIYALPKIYVKGPSTVEQINNLKTSDIPVYDRGAVYPYDETLDKNSYYPFYAAIPLPFVAFLMTDDLRNDYWKLCFLYWEAMSFTGFAGIGGPYFIDRYRPYAYTSETPMEKRTGQNAKNSAFAGHVEIVAVSTFFIAKVYGDYYPDTRIVMFSLAGLATAGMSYARLVAGMHFPSDIVIGAAIGTLSGILVPQFHKQGTNKNQLGILPYSTGDTHGLALIYKLNK